MLVRSRVLEIYFSTTFFFLFLNIVNEPLHREASVVSSSFYFIFILLLRNGRT